MGRVSVPPFSVKLLLKLYCKEIDNRREKCQKSYISLVQLLQDTSFQTDKNFREDNRPWQVPGPMQLIGALCGRLHVFTSCCCPYDVCHRITPLLPLPLSSGGYQCQVVAEPPSRLPVSSYPKTRSTLAPFHGACSRRYLQYRRA